MVFICNVNTKITPTYYNPSSHLGMANMYQMLLTPVLDAFLVGGLQFWPQCQTSHIGKEILIFSDAYTPEKARVSKGAFAQQYYHWIEMAQLTIVKLRNMLEHLLKPKKNCTNTLKV